MYPYSLKLPQQSSKCTHVISDKRIRYSARHLSWLHNQIYSRRRDI